jgi:hypothetical protein
MSLCNVLVLLSPRPVDLVLPVFNRVLQNGTPFKHRSSPRRRMESHQPNPVRHVPYTHAVHLT